VNQNEVVACATASFLLYVEEILFTFITHFFVLLYVMVRNTLLLGR